jgi:uncharacterized protein (TIGR02186 family)
MNPTACALLKRLFLAWVVFSALASPAAEPSLTLSPAVIEMGPFYGGAQVRIDGIVAQGSQVAVVVRGADVEEVFNKKARMGPIWINGEKVQISGVPSLFLCFTSAPLSQMLARRAMDENQLDEEAIRSQLVISPPSADQDALRSDYLSLKRSQGTFRVVEGEVRLGRDMVSGVPFTLDLPWPKRAAPGSYDVRVYQCLNGEVVAQARAHLEVSEVGIPADLARLAKEHASLYGALCVLLAMAAGFGIDLIVMKLGRQNLSGH